MKTLLACVLFAITITPRTAVARFLTLTVFGSKPSDETIIATNEVAQIKTTSGSSRFYFDIIRPDATNRLDWSVFTPTHSEYRANPIIAGPARLVFRKYDQDQASFFATIEVTPESFPPDKTIVIPEGGAANIALECSTNLIDWTTAPLGVYTNQPTVKFFRLRAERVP
jgi:hypothetical protein